MLEECASWAKGNGIVVLNLAVVTTNDAAIHSYQRNGFSAYGTEPKSIRVNDIYYDELLMARLL
jgi:RimJ/RimL family protein N-acetyltransferase